MLQHEESLLLGNRRMFLHLWRLLKPLVGLTFDETCIFKGEM